MKTTIQHLLINKLIISGKKSKAFKIYKYLLLLYSYKKLKKNIILDKVISNLIVPFNFKTKKLGVIKYKIPYIIHYYKSITQSLTWFIKNSKLKTYNKTSMYKALYLESLDILKKQGTTYTFKQEFIKKALINRVFIYLLSYKKLKSKI